MDNVDIKVEDKLDGSTPVAEDQSNKTYTEAELQAFLQSETDKRVTSALKKQEEKFKSAQKESEKLRDMDASQRKEYELQQRINDLESKEKEYAIMSNKIECGKILAARGLDASFVDYVVSESAEEMLANIEVFDKAFKAAVSEQVSKKLAGKAPSTSNVSQKGLDKDTFRKLTIAEQAEIYKTNPSLYKQLSS